jgi:hypothetical protein
MSRIIDLGKLRFHFAGEWSGATQYEINDIVKYGGNVYVYTYALKTTGFLPTNTAYWALMVEGFKFRGVYNPATAYKVGDGIAYGGKVYVAVIDSVGQTPPNVTYWSQFADGIQYEGSYNNATAYQKNDVVTLGGIVYIAKQDTTGNIPTNATYWDKLVDGISAKSVYNAGTQYYVGDLVAYGPNIYRAIANTIGNVPTNATYWESFITGSSYKGAYSGATQYYANDIVNYGSNVYISKETQLNVLPTVTASWDLLVSGFSYQGVWSGATQYYIGQVISYGGSLFQAKSDNLNVNPTTTATWDKLVYGFKYRSNWATSTNYGIDEVVVYGGNTYVSLVPHTSGTFATDLAAAKWEKFNSGVLWNGVWATTTFYKVGDIVTRGGNSYVALLDHTSGTFETDFAASKWQRLNAGIRWVGDWVTATAYIKDDIVRDSVTSSVYIALQDHTSTASFTDDVTAGKWAAFVAGGASALPAYSDPTDRGRSLTLNAAGTLLDWIGATESSNVYYVAPHGVDNASAGKNLSYPFASVKYACSQATSGSTIFVKSGTYAELQLPITVPANVAIVGDNQRTTIITAGSGLAADGVTPNNESTMFLMSNGSILNKMTFTGMTGWVPGGTPADVTTSTIKGVVVRLNPASPITTKSPYVLECSFIGSGGIGALIDGSVHATGAKTMIFHGYTIISDNGIGYWVKDGGKSEIVSCFTYYCYFGYTASGGGFIRALNGNNSYGTWGCTSRGFDAGETALTGTVFGQELNFLYTGGNINVGDTVTGPTGSATVTNAQLSGSSNKLYVSGATGTFTLGQELTTTSGGTGVVSAGALRDQRGFIIIGTGFSSVPIPGQSITLSDDSISYVIQSVSGTYVDSSSKMVLVLAQEKPTGSANGATITLRSKFSQIRLTGHDFLDIGTGGTVTTNYPGTPTQPPAQGNEVDEAFPGRVYYVSTDQNGNFRVGEYFRIDQATGTATLNANAFNLAGLTSLRLGSIGAQLGETINEFSSDATLSGNSNTAVPTEYAVRTFVINQAGLTAGLTSFKNFIDLSF